MKNILLMNTGGTFSSTGGEHGLTPTITGERILRELNGFEDTARIEVEDLFALDSSNITPDDWVTIARRIAQKLPEFDGFVIIHGTDTMAYTASMLSFMLQRLSVPVVLTGSQMPLGVPLTDAVENLRCAVHMALSGVGGVFIAFDRKILRGCRASKVRTVSFNAFESINYPPVGEVNAFGLQIYAEKAKTAGPVLLQTDYSDRIAVMKLFPGMNPDMFRYLRDKGCEGIYIEGFGLGGVPFLKSDFTREIRAASEAGLPILVGSQCRYEGSNLNIYETGQRILECGGIPVHDMTQEAVVTKLMWALGQTKKREQIRWLFATNIVDEVTL